MMNGRIMQALQDFSEALFASCGHAIGLATWDEKAKTYTVVTDAMRDGQPAGNLVIRLDNLRQYELSGALLTAAMNEQYQRAFAAFFGGFITCALWASTDNSDETGGSPLDDNYDASDLSAEALAVLMADCASWLHSNADDLGKAADADGRAWLDYLERAGHDYFLTRNHHGAGFWDRGLGEIGDVLTKAADAAGSCDLYISDAGEIEVF